MLRSSIRLLVNKSSVIRTSQNFTGLTAELKSVSETSTNKQSQVSILADIYSEMLNREINDITSIDAIRVVKYSSRIKIYDSELFKKFEQIIPKINSFTDFLTIVKSMNRIEKNFFKSSFFKYINEYPESIINAEISQVIIPCMQYVIRPVVITRKHGNTFDENDSTSAQLLLNLVLESIGAKVELIKSDLPKFKSIVSSDDAVKIISLLGSFKRVYPQFKLVSSSHKDSLVYICQAIISYDLRSMSLEKLLKLFFSMSEIELFDDFFVRRRLVPAIANMYSNGAKTARETALVQTMVDMLPFDNQLVKDLKQELLLVASNSS